jgi:hypothetical protein
MDRDFLLFYYTLLVRSRKKEQSVDKDVNLLNNFKPELIRKQKAK